MTDSLGETPHVHLIDLSVYVVNVDNRGNDNEAGELPLALGL